LLLENPASSEVQQQFWQSRPRACFLIGHLTDISGPAGTYIAATQSTMSTLN
jgi:hypothetical protein